MDVSLDHESDRIEKPKIKDKKDKKDKKGKDKKKDKEKSKKQSTPEENDYDSSEDGGSEVQDMNPNLSRAHKHPDID
jgi:hypothetical protein